MQDAIAGGDSHKNTSTPDPKAEKSQINPSVTNFKK